MFNLDSFLDLFDLDGDADENPLGNANGALGEDGLPFPADAAQLLLDFDGDGIPDAVAFQQLQDLDGDGVPDAVAFQQFQDLDGDGVPDAVIFQQFQDLDGDGVPDVVTYQQLQDLDGDGTLDVVGLQQFQDLDGDGVPDVITCQQLQDLDGDGVPDTRIVQQLRDLDGDGVPDLLLTDTDGDGVVDLVQTAEDFGNDGIIEGAPEHSGLEGQWDNDGDSGYMDGCAPTYVTFDPDRANMDRVIGEPGEAMESWHWQETTSSCAVASQEFVLEQLTGREFDESDLRELAEEQGWYAPESGTPMDDVGNILEHMGLNVERSHGNSIQDLEECLRNGGEVIVGVDSSEIWEGQDDDFFGPGMDADHAVQVIGLDYSDPGSPMVILNDPGTANGGGAMLPLDVFMGAWEDSGCFMVEAYA